MKIVHKTERKLFKNNENCDVLEYDLGCADLGGAAAEIRGRYPDSGRVVNAECKEVAYILKGAGEVNAEGNEMKFAAGDVIVIEKGERYFWEGNFSALLFSAPAWRAGQCEKVD
ncbi:MAG: cupin domain-containing protein [Patescibacteria group bacterium]